MWATMLGLTVALMAALTPVRGVTAPVAQSAARAAPHFRHAQLSDGVAGAYVYAVAQDQQGAIWFGTVGGLTRYDGVSFTTFRHDINDAHSLPNNAIYALFVDRDNGLWVAGVVGGLSRYDRATNHFQRWQHRDGDPTSLAADEVWSIAQTPDGTVWVGTQNGLDRLRADGRGFDHIRLPATAAPTAPGAVSSGDFGVTRALLAESNGRLWAATENGIFRRSVDGQWQRIPVDPSFKGNPGQVWRINGSGNDVRIAGSDGLLQVAGDNVARSVSPVLDGVRAMGSVRDKAGRLWVNTSKGLYVDDGKGGFSIVHGHPLMPGGYPSEWTWQMLSDREGGLWFAAANAGAAYLSPNWNDFHQITHVPDDPASLTTTAVDVVAASRDGQLWVGEVGGLDKLDPATGHVQHVLSNLPTTIFSIAEDRQGRLWLCTEGKLLVLDDGKLAPVGDAHAPVPITRPLHAALGPDGQIYVTSQGQGVFAIDPQTRRATALTLDDKSPATGIITSFKADARHVWYTSEGGLLWLDAAGTGFVHVPGVARGNVRGFATDASGVWIALVDKFEHYRYAGDHVTRDRVVPAPKDWQKVDFLGMASDGEGGVWILASGDLIRLDAATGRFRMLGNQGGLFSAKFNSDTTASLPDGMLYAATRDGVLGFDPRQFAAPPQPMAAPVVSLADVQVIRRGQLQSLPIDNQPVQLGWRDRNFRVDARVASYIDPTANRYRFRLVGFDPDWVDVESDGKREFAGLSAGSYRLEIKAAGPGQAWGYLRHPLLITVQAPPWARWWAWLTYGLLLASAVWLLARAWRQRLARRHQMQLSEQQRVLAEQASAAKTEFLATLSHEIRTPMTGVIGMAELLLTTPLAPRQLDYAQSVQRSGKMLLKLLNDALDLARIEAGRLELEPAPFDAHQLLTDVAQMVAGQAQAKSIDFVLDIAPDLPPWLVGDAVRIKQILINLAHNAVKFTERGSVTLGGQAMAEGVLFSVSDTGPGIPEASQARLFQRFEQMDGAQRQAGSGLGLAICRELVTMMGGSVELQSRVAHGSTFRVRLPLAAPVIDEAAAPAVPASGIVNATGRYRVLLVEDDVTVAAVIRGLLEQHGHQVSHVANGLGALAELSHGVFDVLLLDLDLPGVDGFQIARLVRQREVAGEHLPIVAITARAGGQEETQTRAVGMDGFLRKPLTGEQLITAIGAVAVPTLDEMDV